MYMCIYIYRLIPGPGTTYDGVGGWGGMLTFMWSCRSSWCYAHAFMFMLMMMMMMMMTLMNPNEACQFCDKISSRNWQVLPTYNSGLRGSRTGDKAIYTIIYIYSNWYTQNLGGGFGKGSSFPTWANHGALLSRCPSWSWRNCCTALSFPD